MENLQKIEVRGIRVLTTKQISTAYGIEDWKIKQNFKNNQKRYVEGKHYICLQGEELRAFKSEVENFYFVGKTANKLYLWTEKGALLHAKSLNTDKAWEVYDYLVDFYFRAKEKSVAEIVPVHTNTESIDDVESQDAISIFKVLLKLAESKGITVKTKDLKHNRSILYRDRLAVKEKLTLEEVNYELAFELFHAVVNYDKGDMIKSPLSKYYFSQAERAATLMIDLLKYQIE